MGVISKPYTFQPNTTIQSAQSNSNFDTIYTEFNGNIENANVSASAAIAESKIGFNTSSGHRHNGSDSRLIGTNLAFTWFLDSNQAIGAGQGPRWRAPENMTIVKCWLDVITAPTGADILIDINKNGTTIWTTQGNRGKIVAGNTSNSTTTFDVTSLTAGDYLDLDIDQVGSTLPGAKLTIILECNQN